MAKQDTISSTTQQFLDIYDITSDTVIMKDGSASLILSVNAINFGLLAEEEQDAIIYSYAGLLNSLNYTIQILITSQTKDVSNYLHKLEAKENETTDRKRRLQISQYRQFVTDLIQDRNVLDKKFYVVIPANALEMGLLSAQSVLPGVKNPDISNIERSVILEKAKTILEPKRDHLIGQFARIGLYARQLATQEIIQLFYNRYNPEASEGQKITDSRAYTTPVVEARIQGVTMTDMSQNTKPSPDKAGSTPAAGGASATTPPAPSTPTTPPPAMPADKAAEAISGNPAPATPNPSPAGSAPAAPTPGSTPAVAPTATPPSSAAPAAPTPSTAGSTPVPATDAQAAIDSTLKEIGGSGDAKPAPAATATPGSAQAAAPTPPTSESGGVSVPPQENVSASSGGNQQGANAAMPPLPEI